MKKLCNKCGSELDIAKRFCDHCGAFNPFYISSFKSTNAGSDRIEKRKLEELVVNESKESNKPIILNTENNSFEFERFEREKSDQDLKQEIQRIKQESEISAKEIREELKQIEETNRRLKNEIEALNNKGRQPSTQAGPVNVSAKPGKKAGSGANGIVIVSSVFILVVGFILGYFYINKVNHPVPPPLQSEVNKPRPSPTPQVVKVPETKGAAADSVTTEHAVIIPPDTMKQVKLLAVSTPPPAKAKPAAKPAAKAADKPVTPAKSAAKDEFVLTESKAKGDLVGKKLSGCGVSVNKASEVVSLQNLVLVEELPSGAVKYKCIAKIVQGGDTYTVTPYMYYNTDGVLINVDGTNCE